MASRDADEQSPAGTVSGIRKLKKRGASTADVVLQRMRSALGRQNPSRSAAGEDPDGSQQQGSDQADDPETRREEKRRKKLARRASSTEIASPGSVLPATVTPTTRVVASAREQLVSAASAVESAHASATRRAALSAQRPRHEFTVSIALPGSIIANAQSFELRTYLAGQIARAAAVFRIDEIIVFTEDGTMASDTAGGRSDPNIFLARLLQYLEVPQYLRKAFIPRHADLQCAGLLNPLDTPHHMRDSEPVPFREGVVLKKNARNGHSWADVGLKHDVLLDRKVPPGLRVTVALEYPDNWDQADVRNRVKLTGRVVSPSEPTKAGLYWGYSTRLAAGLTGVLTECPYPGGYDLTIGTSEHGISVSDPKFSQDLPLGSFKHALLVFGGLHGLEECILAEEALEETDPRYLFDRYINVLPDQGSRTIRTEEAVLVALGVLGPYLGYGAVAPSS